MLVLGGARGEALAVGPNGEEGGRGSRVVLRLFPPAHPVARYIT
jgi:hypothetical protein